MFDHGRAAPRLRLLLVHVFWLWPLLARSIAEHPPLWEGPLVEAHADGIVLHHWPIKVALHVAMCAE